MAIIVAMRRSACSGMTGFDLEGALYTGPFHAALRQAIRRRGLTLDRLRAHLARAGVTVGLTSLSDWQTGRSRPAHPGSLRAVHALEDVLGLPSASLARLLGDVRGPRTGVTDIGPVAELLDALPGGHDGGIELISKHHKLVLDEGGQAAVLWTRTAIRVLRDGVDRYVVRYYGAADGDPALIRVRPLDNCRVGRLLRHPDASAVVYELMFDQTLFAGETWVFESQLVDPTAGRCFVLACGFRYPAEQCVLEVRFPSSMPPPVVCSFGQFDLSDDRHTVEELSVNRHNAVHLVASGVDSGVVGIRWDWSLTDDRSAQDRTGRSLPRSTAGFPEVARLSR